MADQPVKVAVLGGGPAGLAAAFELSDPRHNGKFEVSVYQLGWRLGGKCASGREQQLGHRIKEHGPHIFFGFYDNGFAILRQAYHELQDDTPRVFPTIEDALVPKTECVIMEQVDGTWLPWVITLPRLPGVPGTPQPPTESEIVRSHLKSIRSHLLEMLQLHPLKVPQLLAGIEGVLATVADLTLENLQHVGRDMADALKGLQQTLHVIFDNGLRLETAARRLFILLDLGLAAAVGALLDGLVWPTPQSAQAVNELDYREWLKKHEARDITINSAVVRAMYDTVFGYLNADPAGANVEAGSAVLAQKELIVYRGPIAWKMRAGTGDVVAAPLYQALLKRKVTFHFFHRVDRLFSSDGHTIDRIVIGRQATVKNEPYDPLIDCKNLPTWPDRPRFEQLLEGAQLEARQIDLEAAVTDWVDPQPPLTLSLGEQFDKVVLAIPIGALDSMAPQPLKPTWRVALDNSATVSTMSVQVWMNRTADDAGWDAAAAPVVTAYDLPALNTWLDATEVIEREDWPDPAPAQMAILCGAMALPLGGPPPTSQHFPSHIAGLASQAGQAFLNQSVALWPGLQDRDGFDWAALVAPAHQVGPDRFLSQHWVASAHPWDRYVLTPAGSSKCRLAADGSGYDNLVLAGDWTNYGINLGSFEGAVTSGLRAANVITGDPRPILRDPFERS
jgi:uncharacterized protein with NAD-binding domain and iron-sulfur cluster